MVQVMYVCSTGAASAVPLIQVAEGAVAAGIRLLQLRHKGDYTEEWLAFAFQLQRLCKKSSVTFIINDQPEVARQLDADGVHVGQEDVSIATARRILGGGKIVGTTGSTLEHATRAQAEGADYISLGHIYPTTCKPKNYPPIGTDILRKAKEIIDIPIWAIGGIDSSNVHDVASTYIDGVAVISAIQMAKDPYAATRELIDGG